MRPVPVRSKVVIVPFVVVRASEFWRFLLPPLFFATPPLPLLPDLRLSSFLWLRRPASVCFSGVPPSYRSHVPRQSYRTPGRSPPPAHRGIREFGMLINEASTECVFPICRRFNTGSFIKVMQFSHRIIHSQCNSLVRSTVTV